MKARTLQVRRNTAANATANNPTLAEGEIGFETDTGKFKIGDGSTAWNSLAYAAVTPAGAAVTYAALGAATSAFTGDVTAARVAVNASAWSTVEKFRVNTPTTASSTANALLAASATSATPLVVQGATSQTANLQEWQDSTGTVLASVTAAGALTLQQPAATTGTIFNVYDTTNATNAVNLETVAQYGGMYPKLTLTGTVSTGGIGGQLEVRSAGDAVFGFVAQTRVATFNSAVNTRFEPYGAAGIGLRIQGKSAQTGDLLRFTNSSATVLASVSANGRFVVGDGASGGVQIGSTVNNLITNSGANITHTTGTGGYLALNPDAASELYIGQDADTGKARMRRTLRFNEGKDIWFGTTTGTKIGANASQLLALWGATPIVQPTTGVAAATFTENSGTAINDASTFDGYTIKQVVKALRNIGALA